ncbi:Coilin [Thalictrum thalictroides]|uniref:Coilin n=1 Tax=Thalictrum thalictroides TaxID=46969 RepID=A0A7J6X9Z2_THATH|nr:Coilin [Thalictrum thalictroides]
MESVRLGVVFEDRNVLTKSQKSQGLKRSLILLKPDFETISDLSSYLTNSFDLHHSCPNGLRISMDGFVLPPFESTRVFKDKDIIRVKRKDGGATDTNGIDGGTLYLEDSEVEEKQPLLNGVKLLALEGVERETESYQSEPEDIECENTLHLETSSSGKKASKKRKSSKKMPSTKRRKIKNPSPEKSLTSPAKGVENDDHLKDPACCSKEVHLQKPFRKDRSSKTSVKLQKTRPSEVCNGIEDKNVHMSKRERCDNLQEKGGKSKEEVVPEGTKKGPSRSARRKKAKRQWLRELLNSQKEELIQSMPDKVVHNKSQEHQELGEETDTEAEVVPIVVRPGHIRFEPLDEDQVDQQTQAPVENFKWNGITSKRKGQKWGMEKSSVINNNGYENYWEDSIEIESSQWNGVSGRSNGQKWTAGNALESKRIDDENSGGQSSEELNIKRSDMLDDPVDFEKLKPLSCLPKEGDVVAYRLVELSSTWCPELSAFRVGKVLWVEPASNKVMLAPVPGYPIKSEEVNEEETTQETATSLYMEDGLLEIDFASLVDVRIFNPDHSNPVNSKEAPVSNKEAPESSKEAVPYVKSNENSKGVTTTEKGSVDVWEEISQVLSEKKTQLSKEKEESWTQKESSGKSQWSYRALRSSALGPTMALLRAGNGI